MTIIYRVETHGGIGPYKLFDTTNELNAMVDSHCDSAHPGPFADGLRNLSDMEYFGFISRESLIAWFSGWEYDLNDCGMLVVEYDCNPDDYRKGSYQVAFYREFATKVATHDIIEFIQA